MSVRHPRRIGLVRVILVHGAAASQEEVPFNVGNLLFAPHDLGAKHEGEHDLVAFEQTSAYGLIMLVRVNVCVCVCV